MEFSLYKVPLGVKGCCSAIGQRLKAGASTSPEQGDCALGRLCVAPPDPVALLHLPRAVFCEDLLSTCCGSCLVFNFEENWTVSCARSGGRMDLQTAQRTVCVCVCV